MASTVPIYIQIRSHVMELIKKSRGQADKIHSERALSDMFNANRLTVRKALKKLVDEGYLIPCPGKGTFINPKWFPTGPGGISYESVGIIESNGQTIHFDWSRWKEIAEIGVKITENGKLVECINVSTVGEKAATEILSRNIAGLVWITPTYRHVETIKALESRGLPVTVANSSILDVGLTGASSDYFQLGYSGAKWLLEQWAKKIVYVAESSVPSAYNPMKGGFLKALDDAGMVCDKKSVLQDNRNFRNNLKKLISQDNCRSFFVLGKYIPIFNQLLSEFEKNLVHEFSVAAEYLPAEIYHPLVTNKILLERPFEKVAEKAVEKLFDLMAGKKVPNELTLIKQNIIHG